MPHIDIPDNLPGIGGLTAFRPETARVLSEFVDILLRQRNSLETGEREIIVSYVSGSTIAFIAIRFTVRLPVMTSAVRKI